MKETVTQLSDGNSVFEISSTELSSLIWLVEFFRPTLEILEKPGLPDWKVSFVVFEPLFESLNSQLSKRAQDLEGGFTFDGHSSSHRGWSEQTLTFFCECSNSLVQVSEDCKQIGVVVGKDHLQARITLMRVVRELLTGVWLSRGWLPLHASSFSIRGEGFLLCGPRRAGKSSLLLHALRSGADYISNDRAFLSPDGKLVGMPTIVSIRQGTLARFPGLSKRFVRTSFDRRLTLAADLGGMPAGIPEGKDCPALSPAQYCHLLDVPMKPDSPARTILFPRISTESREILLEVVEPEDAARKLYRNLLRPGRTVRTSKLLWPQRKEVLYTPEEELAACRRLSRNLTAYSCSLGADAYKADFLAMF